MMFESIIKRVNLSKLSRREKDHRRRRGWAFDSVYGDQLVIVPVFERNTRLRGAVQSKTQILDEMQQLEIRIRQP